MNYVSCLGIKISKEKVREFFIATVYSTTFKMVGDKKWSLFSSLNVKVGIFGTQKINSNFLFMHNIQAAGVAFSKGGNYKMRKVIG